MARAWVLGSVAYGLLRTALVWKFLSGYGVNPWWFGVVELGSSALYGVTSGRLVMGLVDENWTRVYRFAPAALLCYFAPDAYVFATVGRLPSDLLRTLVAIVALSAVLTAVSLIRTVRRNRGSNPPRTSG